MTTPANFSELLLDLSAGRTKPRLEKAMADLIDKCQSLGQKGQIILKIDVQPMGDDMIRFEDEITVKEPKPKKMATTFFMTERGLSRRDPRQTDIEDYEQGDDGRPHLKQVK